MLKYNGCKTYFNLTEENVEMWLTRALTILVTLILMEYSRFNSASDDEYYNPFWEPEPVTGDDGSRLILTQYIESGNITEARRLSEVRDEPFNDDIPSYSGFFTVNKTYNSNLFFWFFPSKLRHEDDPLILWLQGGPGFSSLLGIFKEIGPYSIGRNFTLKKNPYSWYNNYSLLFFDNPVGAGFSFTDDENGYAREDQQIGVDVYSALIQFFTMFPELQENPLFIVGQSYGGKHAPTVAYTIHRRNPNSHLKMNLKGIAVGNGFTDPITQFGYSEYVYQLGLIDTKTYEEMKIKEEKVKEAIREGNFELAADIFNNIQVLFSLQSKYDNNHHILQSRRPKHIGEYVTLAQQTAVRKAIHVGDAEFTNYLSIYNKLYCSLMRSVRPWLEVLIDNYKVLYYNGQLDIIVAYSTSVLMFSSLQFTGAEEYKNATRFPWYVDGELAGYVKSAGNFTEVLVRNAGHMVPVDQPKWSLYLIGGFISNTLKNN